MRKWLKEKIPHNYWPAFKAIDKRWIDLLYLGYLCQRIYYQIRCHEHVASRAFPQFQFQCNVDLPPGETLVDYFQKSGINYSEGRHSIYINRKIIPSVCSGISDFYPHPCGVKIIKGSERSPDGTVYYTSAKLAPASNSVTMRAVGSVLEKSILSNLLNIHGVAPRVYDLAKIRIGNDCYQAMVVQDIRGQIVRGDRGADFIKKFKDVLKIYGIKTLGKRNHKDFRPPDFRNNIVSDNGNLFYVDIQNFVLFNCRQTIRLRNTIFKTNATQYDCGKKEGEKRRFLLRKRKAERQRNLMLETIDTVLARHEISFKRAYIADIGCREGRLLLHVLEKMAAWYLGITRAVDTTKLRETLFIQGATRFDLIPCDNSATIMEHPMAKKGADILFFRDAEHRTRLPGWIKKFPFRYMFFIGLNEKDLAPMSEQVKSETELTVMESCLLSERGNIKRPIILAAK